MTTVAVYNALNRRELWHVEGIADDCITLSRGACQLATFGFDGRARKGATGHIAPRSLRRLNRQMSRVAATGRKR
jgi:hypothetical protein